MTNREPSDSLMWRAGDGWACALTLIALVFGIEGWLRIGARRSPFIAQWLGTISFRAGFMIFLQGLPLLIVLWFSRVRSIRQFLSHAGLKGRPSFFGWCSAWAAIGIGALGLYGVAKGWAPPDRLYRQFYYRGGSAQCFFVLYAIAWVPLCEEITMRGFLYRAFRGSYGQSLSTFLILCLATISHWGRVSDSMFAFVCIGSAAILLCGIRERTENLWNCVLFHSMFNAMALRMWAICLIAMIFLLPCLRGFDQQFLAKRKELT
jgi:membrane protease YdiL (CAAX protease family)